jgi:hypothetical protein
MKIGLGLYRHMLARGYYDFARQAGCTHVVVHLVDYFNQVHPPPGIVSRLAQFPNLSRNYRRYVHGSSVR